MNHENDPLRPHSHDPNPEPPSADPSFTVIWPGRECVLAPHDLRAMPAQTVPSCYIVSTGHGTSGPFAFTGVPVLTLIRELAGDTEWTEVAVVSGDGFGTRFYREELLAMEGDRPALLAYAVDGELLSRSDGLVRLIEPSETDDALRQVKWVARVVIGE